MTRKLDCVTEQTRYIHNDNGTCYAASGVIAIRMSMVMSLLKMEVAKNVDAIYESFRNDGVPCPLLIEAVSRRYAQLTSEIGEQVDQMAEGGGDDLLLMASFLQASGRKTHLVEFASPRSLYDEIRTDDAFDGTDIILARIQYDDMGEDWHKKGRFAMELERLRRDALRCGYVFDSGTISTKITPSEFNYHSSLHSSSFYLCKNEFIFCEPGSSRCDPMRMTDIFDFIFDTKVTDVTLVLFPVQYMVSELEWDVYHLNLKVDELESEVDRLNSEVDRLNSKVDHLNSEVISAIMGRYSSEYGDEHAARRE